jgi:hypothetical protein
MKCEWSGSAGVGGGHALEEGGGGGGGGHQVEAFEAELAQCAPHRDALLLA